MPAPRRTVGELMSSPPVTATPSDTVAETAARMRDGQVGSVVVVDGRRPIGILTERDLIRFAASGAETAGTKVSEWMTEDPDVVSPGLDAADALASLDSHGYRHIPVVDDGELVGVVSLRDLMRVLSAGRWQTLWLLEIPAVLPTLFGGLRIAVTLAVIGAAVAEFVGSDRGLGYLIQFGNRNYQQARTFAALVVLAAVALLLYGVVVLAERYALRNRGLRLSGGTP